MLAIPRRLLFGFQEDLAVRLLGGDSLLVLCKLSVGRHAISLKRKSPRDD